MDISPDDPLIGRTVDGRYTVEALVARGGMATVYRARDIRLDRKVALKVLHPHLAQEPGYAARFVQEAQSAARLSHPNVVGVYDQGQVGELFYLVLEFLQGQTLREALDARGALTARELFTVALPVIEGLAAAHQAGVVHRDIKPENVILTDSGQVKVADFGLARAVGTGQTSGPSLGTAAYMAPELLTDGQASPACDVYAAGVMIFELLTGEQPLAGDTVTQIALRHVQEDVPAPSSVEPVVPEVLDELVRQATLRPVRERTPDAGALLAQLKGARALLRPDELDRVPAAADRAARAFVATAAAGAGARVDVGTPPSSSGDDTEVLSNLAVTQVLPPLFPGGATTISSGPVGAFGRIEGAPLPPGEGAGRALSRREQREHPARLGGALVGAPAGRRDVPGDMVALARRRRRRGTAALLAIVLVASLLAVGGWWFAAGPGASVPVPGVRNLSYEEAAAAIRKVGLTPEQGVAFDDTLAPGRVVGTDPAQGSDATKGSQVSVLISQGPAKVKVPKTVGMTQAQAAAVLKKAHLNPAEGVNIDYSDTVPKNLVITTDPPAGRTVGNGSSVTLTLSKGRVQVLVPDVVSRTQDDAIALLETPGFLVKTTADFSSSVPAGFVMDQKPSGGTTVGHGSTVTITISKGPNIVVVPDVVGKQLREARAILEGAGLTVQVNRIAGGFFGTVRFEDPAPGTQLPSGSTVTIGIV